jgi:hypothetical protein
MKATKHMTCIDRFPGGLICLDSGVVKLLFKTESYAYDDSRQLGISVAVTLMKSVREVEKPLKMNQRKVRHLSAKLEIREHFKPKNAIRQNVGRGTEWY